MFTVPLRLASNEPINKIGSKAMQLAKLAEVNITIPEGFVITSDALNGFILDNGLLDRDEASFMDRFTYADFPSEMKQEISEAFTTLLEKDPSNMAVAVRSSSTAEDLNDASFAGQYETILNVTGIPRLFASIKRCWASLFSQRIQEYAQQRHIDLSLRDVSMAVLVQQMVQADVSGVIFSMNPVTGNRDEIMINASYGLGESIVSGLVTPDMYCVNKKNGSIAKELGVKELKIVADQQEIVQLETTLGEQNRFCLSDHEIAELVHQTQKIEAYFGTSVDIEFAIKNGRVYILQARPVTTS